MPNTDRNEDLKRKRVENNDRKALVNSLQEQLNAKNEQLNAKNEQLNAKNESLLSKNEEIRLLLSEKNRLESDNATLRASCSIDVMLNKLGRTENVEELKDQLKLIERLVQHDIPSTEFIIKSKINHCNSISVNNGEGDDDDDDDDDNMNV